MKLLKDKPADRKWCCTYCLLLSPDGGEAVPAVTEHRLQRQMLKSTVFIRCFSIVFDHSKCVVTGVQSHFYTHTESGEEEEGDESFISPQRGEPLFHTLFLTRTLL